MYSGKVQSSMTGPLVLRVSPMMRTCRLLCSRSETTKQKWLAGHHQTLLGFLTVFDKKDTTFFYSYALLDSKGNSIKFINDKITLSASATGPIKVKVNIGYNYVNVKEGEYSYSFAVSTVTNPTPPRTFFVVEK